VIISTERFKFEQMFNCDIHDEPCFKRLRFRRYVAACPDFRTHGCARSVRALPNRVLCQLPPKQTDSGSLRDLLANASLHRRCGLPRSRRFSRLLRCEISTAGFFVLALTLITGNAGVEEANRTIAPTRKFLKNIFKTPKPFV